MMKKEKTKTNTKTMGAKIFNALMNTRKKLARLTAKDDDDLRLR